MIYDFKPYNLVFYKDGARRYVMRRYCLVDKLPRSRTEIDTFDPAIYGVGIVLGTALAGVTQGTPEQFAYKFVQRCPGVKPPLDLKTVELVKVLWTENSMTEFIDPFLLEKVGEHPFPEEWREMWRNREDN